MALLQISWFVLQYIDTCPNTSLVHHNKRFSHPSKYMVVKDKIDKLWNVGLIYQIMYITWV